MSLRLHVIRPAIATAIAASALVLPTPLASVADEPPVAPAHLRTQLRYSFDQGESLRLGTIVHDVSGHRHAGRVLVADNGHLRVVPGIAGRGAGFPASCTRCGKAIIQSRDRASLDPRRHVLLFGTSVKVTQFQAHGDENLVQKGLFDQVGGQYKLQMYRGVPNCVVFGGRGRLVVSAQTSVANGRWHRIDCRRTQHAVTLRVDGRVVGRGLGRTGLIRNSAPVRIGGYSVGGDNDQYHGDLDNVFIRIKS